MKRLAQSVVLIIVLIFGTSILFSGTRASSSSVTKKLSSLKEDETKKLYEKNCAKCHGKDGRAKTFRSKFIHARDFTDKIWQESTGDEQMLESIKNGRGKMPAFKNKLKDQEVKSLIEYIRKFKK
jgi:mono/diheme cytochrome c family protein